MSLDEFLLTLIIGTLLYAWADSYSKPRKPRYDSHLEAPADDGSAA